MKMTTSPMGRRCSIFGVLIGMLRVKIWNGVPMYALNIFFARFIKKICGKY